MKIFSEHRNLLTGLSMVLAVFLIVFINFGINQPPEVTPADAPEEVFSAKRAANHLPYIASKPNPIGSEANREVRDYIIGQLELLGLTPELHYTGLFQEFHAFKRATKLDNVMVRIPGTGDGKAILFMGHYDSVVTAPGASDNGAAVITLLEILRMLQHHPPLKNDLIFFFPDGEEYGLLGAQAFKNEHPWIEDVEMIVNFEAMGTKGQSVMFETGYNNRNIIREFAKAVPYPIANSISVEIYNRMSNATDFCVFKDDGYMGLNFAYIGNSFDYHTMGDNIENTDLRSVQHHGSYGAALALHLGNMSLDVHAGQDAVYFNTIGYGFAHYPYSRVTPIALFVFLIAAGFVITGVYKKKINIKRMLSGFVAFLLKLLLLYVVFDSVYNIISSYYTGEDYRLIQYHQQGILLGISLIAAGFFALYVYIVSRGVKIWHLLTMLGFLIIILLWSGDFSILKIVVGIAAPAWLFFFHRKPLQVWDFSAGTVSVWAIVMLVISIILPGASYLVTYPLLFILLALGILLFFDKAERNVFVRGAILLIFAAPAILWFPVTMQMFNLAMGIQLAGILMIIAGLMFGLLIPHFYMMLNDRPWVFSGAVVIAGLIIFLNNVVALDFDERHRKRNYIIYANDGETGESYWMTFANSYDEWTKQFLTEEPDTICYSRFFPLGSGEALVKKSAEASLEPARVELLTDSIIDDKRMLQFFVEPVINPMSITFFVDGGGGEVAVKLPFTDEEDLDQYEETNWHRFIYLAPPYQGFGIKFYTEPEAQISLHINEYDYSGIPAFINYNERPQYTMNGGDYGLVSSFYRF